MKVLNVGSGAGDVALLLADLVLSGEVRYLNPYNF
jgi:hypothetical protein